MTRQRFGLPRLAVSLLLVLALLPAPAAAQQYGDLSFPEDEHVHGDGLDYWWGAAGLVAESGNRYTVGMAYTSFFGNVVTGAQVIPHQGPYLGRWILSELGPEEWGHPASSGAYLVTGSVRVPLLSELLTLQTASLADGGRVIDGFRRTSLDTQDYALVIDSTAAEVHPDGPAIRWATSLDIRMHDGPPLLSGGTGTWWYGIPETFGYPSNSFQYSQASRQVSGTLELEQPDGSILTEVIDPDRSGFVMVHEYDESPQDIPAGLGVAQATQMSPTYAQYYQGGMPWEIVFVGLENGAQLKLVVMAFHFTEEGTLAPVIGPDQPTYRILATLRLPSGESIPLDDDLFVEHLNYREVVGRVPTAFVQVWGQWLQGWDMRVGFPGGRATAGDGSQVDIPPFDLGLTPSVDARAPMLDAEGRGLVQRVPYEARGTWDGCPMHGAGWSELIINWQGRTDKDPWYTGGDLPEVPATCGPAAVSATPGNGLPLVPDPNDPPPPAGAPEGCNVVNPGADTCTYTATMDGGIGGNASAPGSWSATITRPGRPDPSTWRVTRASACTPAGSSRPATRSR